MQTKTKKTRTVFWLCVTAMFMALNVVMSSFSISVPGGHLYLNDLIICTAAILLDPLAAIDDVFHLAILFAPVLTIL